MSPEKFEAYNQFLIQAAPQYCLEELKDKEKYMCVCVSIYIHTYT